ncbi:MAG: CHAT domain-containing protein [Planctomycetota bacterium]
MSILPSLLGLALLAPAQVEESPACLERIQRLDTADSLEELEDAVIALVDAYELGDRSCLSAALPLLEKLVDSAEGRVALLAVVGMGLAAQGAGHESAAAVQEAMSAMNGVELEPGVLLDLRAPVVAVTARYEMSRGNLDGAMALLEGELELPHGPRALSGVLGAMSTCHRRRGEYEEAEALARESLELARDVYPDGHPAIAARAVSLVAVLHRLNRFDEGRELGEEAVRIAERHFGTERIEFAETLNALSLCLVRPEDRPRRAEVAQQVYDVVFATTPPGHPHRAVVAENLANDLGRVGDYDRALAILDVAVEEAVQRGPDGQLDVAYAHELRSQLFKLIGSHREEFAALQAGILALERGLGSGPPLFMATLLGEQSICALRLGDHRGALDLSARAVSIVNELGRAEDRDAASILFARAYVLGELGDDRAALELHLAALDLRRKFDAGRPVQARSSSSVGHTYIALDREREAEPYLREALAIRESTLGPTAPETGVTCLQLGDATQQLGRLDEARAYFERALACLTSTRELPELTLDARFAYAGILEEIGETEAALDQLLQVADGYDALGRVPNVGLLHRGRWELARERFAEAERLFSEFADQIERVRFESTVTGPERNSLFQEIRRLLPFEHLARVYLETDRPLAAIEALERGHGWTFAETIEGLSTFDLESVMRVAAEEGDGALEDEARDLMRRWSELEDRESRRLQAMADARRDALEATVDEARTLIEAAAAPLRTLDEERGELRARERTLYRSTNERLRRETIADLRSSLDEGEAAVWIWRPPGTGSAKAAVLVVAQDSTTGFVTGDVDAEDAARVVAASAIPGRGFGTPATSRDVEESLRRISSAIVTEDLRAELGKFSRILVVRDAFLSGLPLELTYWSDEGPQRWLGHGPSISYIASIEETLSIRRTRSRRSATRRRALVFGNPQDGNGAPEFAPAGALVVGVEDASAAHGVGLRSADVVVSVRGEPVTDGETARAMLERVEGPGAEMTVWRRGELRRVDAPSPPSGLELASGPAPAAFRRSEAGIAAVADYERRAAPLRELPALAGALREARQIAKLADEAALDVQLRTGSDATERQLGDDAQSATLVHLACHAITDRSLGGPLLVLARPETIAEHDDGILSLEELLSRRWRGQFSQCELVVLSACSTHVGKLRKNEAPETLALGLAQAGAKAAILSSWDVDDEWTAKLMERFYALYLGEGLDPLAALDRARLELARDGAPVSAWAAFVHTGDPR